MTEAEHVAAHEHNRHQQWCYDRASRMYPRLSPERLHLWCEAIAHSTGLQMIVFKGSPTEFEYLAGDPGIYEPADYEEAR